MIERPNVAIVRSGLRNVDIARALGCTSQAVGKWRETGAISKAYLSPLAALVKVSTDWLLSGIERPIVLDRVPFRTVPVIAWNNVEKSLSGGKFLECMDYAAAPVDVGERSFALRMNSDAMEPLIPGDSLVIVDPDCEFAAGAVVLAKLPDATEPIVRRLLSEAGRWILQPENVRYAIEVLPAAGILGVIREIIIRL